MIETPRQLRYQVRDGVAGPVAGDYLVAYHARTRKPTGTAYLVIAARAGRAAGWCALQVIRVPLVEAQSAKRGTWSLWWHTRRKIGRCRPPRGA